MISHYRLNTSYAMYFVSLSFAAVVIYLSVCNVPGYWGWADDALYQSSALDIVHGRAARPLSLIYSNYLAAIIKIFGENPKYASCANIPVYIGMGLIVLYLCQKAIKSMLLACVILAGLLDYHLLWLAWRNFTEPMCIMLQGVSILFAGLSVDLALSDRKSNYSEHRLYLFSLLAFLFSLGAVYTRLAALPFFCILSFSLLFIIYWKRGFNAVLIYYFLSVLLITIVALRFFGLGSATFYSNNMKDEFGNKGGNFVFLVASNCRFYAMEIFTKLSLTKNCIACPLLLSVCVLGGMYQFCVAMYKLMFKAAGWEEVCSANKYYILSVAYLFAYVLMILITPMTDPRYVLPILPFFFLIYFCGYYGLDQLTLNRKGVILLALFALDLLITLRLGWRFWAWEAACVMILYLPLLGSCLKKYDIFKAGAPLGVAYFLVSAYFACGMLQNTKVPFFVQEQISVAHWFRDNVAYPVRIFSRKPYFYYLESKGVMLPMPKLGWRPQLDAGGKFLERIKEFDSEYVVYYRDNDQDLLSKNWLPALESHPEMFKPVYMNGSSIVYKVNQGGA